MNWRDESGQYERYVEPSIDIGLDGSGGGGVRTRQRHVFEATARRQAATPASDAANTSAGSGASTPTSARGSVTSLRDDAELRQELRRIRDAKIRLESEMRFAEREERYADARRLKDKLKKLNVLEAQRVERRARVEAEKRRRDFEVRVRLESDTFEHTWSRKLAEYDRRAKDIVLRTVERQKWENKEAIELLRARIISRKPKFSTKVLELRSLLERQVHARHYLDAERTKRRIRRLEVAEMEKFEKERIGAIEQRMKSVVLRRKQEVEALKMRIKRGRNELLQRRRKDWKRLLRHRENIKTELDRRVKRFMRASAKQRRVAGVVATAPTHNALHHTIDLSRLNLAHLRMRDNDAP